MKLSFLAEEEIHNALLQFSEKILVFPPPRHHFTKLVVRAHPNPRSTALLDFESSSFIKNLVCHCLTCRKVSRKPYKVPDPPPIPNLRLVDLHPFSVTGVDFTHAVYVKTLKGQDKVYIFLLRPRLHGTGSAWSRYEIG